MTINYPQRLVDSVTYIAPEYLFSLIAMDLGTYQSRHERVAMRAALGDAAILCDHMADAVQAQNKRRGHILKAAQEMAAAFKQCGDEIWLMRSMIEVPGDRRRARKSRSAKTQPSI